VYDEDWLPSPIANPTALVSRILESNIAADYFTFTQGFEDTRIRNPYRHEVDNIAAIPILSFADWWERGVSSDFRKDVRRADKRGVEVQTVSLTERFALEIKSIYDESPVRQGRLFWHFGKSVGDVLAMNSSFLDRSVFFGAYLGGELIGFIKVVRCGRVARMMQILTKEAHYEARPGNGLIAAAVRWSHENGFRYLTYGKYTYEGNRNSSVTLFKRRNGFHEILFPRYYVPLNHRGEWMLRFRIHRGYRRFLPHFIIESAKAVRLRLTAGRVATRVMSAAE
jgi:hypothetical protein